MSGRTPVLGSALHRHPHCATINHAWLPLSGLPSGKTQVQGLPQTPLPEQPAAAQTPSPAAVSAPGRLPGHWLTLAIWGCILIAAAALAIKTRGGQRR